eukprot:TRINITY_DN1305_c0_g1_i8.p1 TRINITY_DN1305_c0_g1~~TRINITY_DN1305_c0_g1_i8.p1  ORF type:complete len:110 (+),score=22.57 TRINITY_DN1305_c0_g1_i8:761-1090(+)
MADTIKTVGTTMEFFLRSLPVRSKFNIIGFGTSFEKLFPCSVMYGDHTLAQALSHVTTMNANLGSTSPPLFIPPLPLSFNTSPFQKKKKKKKKKKQKKKSSAITHCKRV